VVLGPAHDADISDPGLRLIQENLVSQPQDDDARRRAQRQILAGLAVLTGTLVLVLILMQFA